MLEFHRPARDFSPPPPEPDLTPARLRAIADRLERAAAADETAIRYEVRRAVPTIRDLAIEAEIANRHLGSAS